MQSKLRLISSACETLKLWSYLEIRLLKRHTAQGQYHVDYANRKAPITRALGV